MSGAPLGPSPTSELAGALDGLVDELERAEQLGVVVAADLVAVDQVAVQVVQLHVALAHVFPKSAAQSDHRKPTQDKKRPPTPTPNSCSRVPAACFGERERAKGEGSWDWGAARGIGNWNGKESSPCHQAADQVEVGTDREGLGTRPGRGAGARLTCLP